MVCFSENVRLSEMEILRKIKLDFHNINSCLLDCVVTQLVSSLLREPECDSSNPTQTRLKFPCFYQQFTITLEIVSIGVVSIYRSYNLPARA